MGMGVRKDPLVPLRSVRNDHHEGNPMTDQNPTTTTPETTSQQGLPLKLVLSMIVVFFAIGAYSLTYIIQNIR
jgi:hypothetical protein